MDPLITLGKTYSSQTIKSSNSVSNSSAMGLAIFGLIVLVVCVWVAFQMSSNKHHRKGRGGGAIRLRASSVDSKRINRWRIKRAAFEEQKKTPFFKDWKREQNQCQYGKCAWCRKSIDLHSPDTHVDHVKPLMWWGTNEYGNLVLACKECNEEKGDSQFGWAGAKGMPGENRKPAWIRPNRCCRNFKEQNSQTVFIYYSELRQPLESLSWPHRWCFDGVLLVAFFLRRL